MEPFSNKDSNKNIKNTIGRGDLDDIRSVYILKYIFEYVSEIKLLKLIKNSHKKQSRLDISLNNYIRFSEISSSIEIDITPANNKYGQFINIMKNDEEYFRIYFNNDEKEIKRSFIEEKENITNIKVIINHKVKSFCGLFQNIKCIKSINFTKYYRNNVGNMSNMFAFCSSLKEINITNYGANNIKNMSKMFSNCLSLNKVTLSNFNTENLSDFSKMFLGCKSLKEVNFVNFNVNNVVNLSYMFSECLALKKLL